MPEPAAPPAAPSPAPEPVVPAPPAPEPSATPTPQIPEDDTVTIAKKKIISPISAPDTPPPTDLNSLMAKEGHSFEDAPPSPHEVAAPHPPGHVITPNPVSPTGEAEDPNKISL